MINKPLSYLWALLAGGFGLFMTFILMNSFSKPLAVILTGIVYLFLGLLVGRLPLRWFWLGWALLAAPVFISFTQIVFQFYQLLHSSTRNLGLNLLSLSLFAVIPPLMSLAGMFWGRYTLKAEYSGEKKSLFQQVLSVLVRTLLPIGLGFLGMFAAMLLNFLCYSVSQGGTPFSLSQFIVYPLVFGLIAGLLSYARGNWLTNSLLVCAFPVLYFAVFIPLNQSGKAAQAGASPAQNLLMTQVVALTVVVALLIGYLGAWLRMRR